MTVEITRELPLDDGQDAQLELHSFLNVLNVLSADLLLFHDTVSSEPFGQTLEECYRISDVFRERPSIQAVLEQFDRLSQQFQSDRQAAGDLGQHPNPQVQEQLAVLVAVVEVLQIRHREMRRRLNQAESWVSFDTQELRREFEEFLGVVEKNSLGRYHIVTNIACKEPKDYLIHLRFTAHQGQSLEMPAVLKDVLRDLLANARKYTEPGGTIEVGLAECEKNIVLAVRDSGRGIPENEVDRVVEFGFRGSNVAAHETKGAGFGLTKAYSVCRRFGGRMWIDSEIGRGTEVRIEIPRRFPSA